MRECHGVLRPSRSVNNHAEVMFGVLNNENVRSGWSVFFVVFIEV